MAWNNNVQQNIQPTRDYAIDWEAKRIPLVAYQNCLTAKEEFLLARQGMGNQHVAMSKNKFSASVLIFYDTVETGFIQWLGLPTVKTDDGKYRKPILFEKKEITSEDYLVLIDQTKLTDDRKIFLLFSTLKNWCFEHGPFQTFTEHDEDIFKELENQE
jgi:4-hydroxyphenylpyruvate dioxygenase-like putative hemolysin